MRNLFRRHHDRSCDGGFSLVEVIVALALITVVMSATAMFFIRSLQSTSLQQQRQGAIAVGEQTLEQARAISLAHLLDGRCSTNVDPVWAAAPADVIDTSTMSAAYSSGNICGTPSVPISTTVSSTGLNAATNRATFTVLTYIGTCYQKVGDATSASGANCVKTDPSPGADYVMYRIVVDVRWTPAKQESCATASGCNYVLTTLRQASTTLPSFNTTS